MRVAMPGGRLRFERGQRLEAVPAPALVLHFQLDGRMTDPHPDERPAQANEGVRVGIQLWHHGMAAHGNHAAGDGPHVEVVHRPDPGHVYRVEIRNSSGQRVWSDDVAAEDLHRDRESGLGLTTFQVPASRLPSGRYEIVQFLLDRGPDAPVQRLKFEVRQKDAPAETRVR